MEELKIKKENVLSCYRNVDAAGKDMLKHLFGNDVFEFDYTSIKTVDDAYKALGINREDIFNGNAYKALGIELLNFALLSSKALFDLWVVCAAINNGKWVDEDEYGYYPYWVLYSKEEIENMSEKDIKDNGICLLAGVRAGSAESAGVRGANTHNRGSDTTTTGGFPLCLNDSKKAKYCGDQFRDLWFQFYGIILKEEGK